MNSWWTWWVPGWFVIAGLAGCSQVAVPITSETSLLESTPAAAVDAPEVNLTPAVTTRVEKENAEPEPVTVATPSKAGQPGALVTAVWVTTTQIILEETEVNAGTRADQDPQALVEQARADLAQRLGINVDLITILETREVTWPDTSLGCPAEGMAYQQVPQNGLLIRLGVEQQMYFYHSDKTGPPFLCEQTLELFKGTPKVDELVPPPDWEIE